MTRSADKKPATKPRRRASKAATSLRARAKQKERARTAALQDGFLAAYASCGIISFACAEVGINRRRHWEWSKDPKYKERFDDAHAKACDVARHEIFRRGIQGWDEPVFGSGGSGVGTVQVGTIRKFSDRMLEIWAKAKMPAEFRERISIGGDPEAPPVRTEDMTPARAAELYRAKLQAV